VAADILVIHEQRTDAVDRVMEQTHATDPPERSPFLERLLIWAAKAALDAASAGIAETLAQAFMHARDAGSEAVKEGLTETAKVFAESGVGAVVEGAANPILDGPDEGPSAGDRAEKGHAGRGGQAHEMTLSNAFTSLQKDALTNDLEDHL